MSDESPAVILYDANGNPIGVSGNKLEAKVAQGDAAALASPWPMKITDGVYAAGVDAANALYVAGKSAPGAAPSSNPVSVSGIDFGGLKRILRTDVLGRLVVTQDNPTGYTVELAYDAAYAATFGAGFYEGLDFVVPAGYKFNAGFFAAMCADNRMTARWAKTIIGGNFNLNTNVFADGASYSPPQFGSYIEAEVATALGNVNDSVVTITYVNQDGVAGRTATFTALKNAPVGFKFYAALQAGDYGVRDITAVSRGLANTGTFLLLIGMRLAELRCTAADTPYTLIPSKDTMIVRAGEMLDMDFYVSGNGNQQRSVRATGVLEPV